MRNVPQYPREALGLTREAPLGEVIDTLYFASLGTEEGAPTRVRLVYHADCATQLARVIDAVPLGAGYVRRSPWEVILLEPSAGVTEFSVATLRKIAPTVNLPHSFVVIGGQSGQLTIQGLAHRNKHTFYLPEGENELFFLSAPRPGHIILMHKQGFLYYEDGQWVKIIRLQDLIYDDQSIIKTAIMNLCSSLFASLPKLLMGNLDFVILDVIKALVTKMTTMPHGGLIVMGESIGARGKYQINSSKQNVLAKRIRIYSQAIADAAPEFRQKPQAGLSEVDEQLERDWEDEDRNHARDALDLLVSNIAQLTAVDKALLLGKDLDLISAGFSISADKSPGELQVCETETIEGVAIRRYALEQHGSKHLAAAFFVDKHPGGIAFVASHDGALRCLHRPVGQKEILLWRLRLND